MAISACSAKWARAPRSTMAMTTTSLSTAATDVLYEVDDPIAIVTLNRPNRRNALSLDLMRELLECLRRIGDDKDVRAVILAAEGKVFSSGHDLKIGRASCRER